MRDESIAERLVGCEQGLGRGSQGEKEDQSEGKSVFTYGCRCCDCASGQGVVAARRRDSRGPSRMCPQDTMAVKRIANRIGLTPN